MVMWKKVIFGSILFGAGLGLGFMASALLFATSKPAIIIKDKWRTVTTAPTPPVVLGHTSLNQDELKTLLTIMETTTTTQAPKRPVPTTRTQPRPSTQPPSSTTSVTETTVKTPPPTATSNSTTNTN